MIANITPGIFVNNRIAIDDITLRPVGAAISRGFVGIAGDTASICSSSTDSLRLYAVTDSCHVATAFQWQVSTDGGISYSDIPGATTLTYTRVPGATGEYLYRLAAARLGNMTSLSCRTASAPLTVIVSPPPSVSITATADTICAGTTVTFVAHPLLTSPGSTIQWLLNGRPVGVGYLIYNTDSLRNGDAISCTVTNSSGCRQTATSNLKKIIVRPVAVPTINITAASTTICAGSPAVFMAGIQQGGSLPQYQWSVNGSPAGSNAATFASSTLHHGDTIRCSLGSNAICAVPATVLSNAVIITITDTTTPVISIMADTNQVCPGTPIRFTATVAFGGSPQGYQWWVNGVAAGNNAPLFTSSSLANGDTVSCTLTSIPVCGRPAVVRSNKVVVGVQPAIIPTITIKADTNNICRGYSVTFTATATGGGSSPTFQWSINGVHAGGNSAFFTSNTLAHGDMVTCTLGSNALCAVAPTTTANPIAMVVRSKVTPTISITATDTLICQGTPVHFTALAGSTGTAPVYSWLVNGIPVGSSPVFSSSSLQNGTVVRCTLISSLACSLPAASNALRITVNPLPQISPGVDKLIAPGGSTLLQPVVTGAIASYLWTPSVHLSAANIPAPAASPVATTRYTLMVTTASGCADTAGITVYVLPPVKIPNVFSPNGDGINDVWNIRYLADYPGCTVQLFNRYGQPVCSSTGYAKPWDGTLNGRPLPAGEYYYIINLNNHQQLLTGGVMLVR